MIELYTDNDLSLLLYKGEGFAFDEIYKRYARKMYTYAFNVLHKQQVCEDLVQNVFLDLWDKRKIRKIDNLSAFLFRAIKFQIFNYFRKKTLTKEHMIRFNLIQDTVEINDTLEYDDLEKIIKNGVENLPNRCQQVFVLSRFENKSNKEIAKELNISIQGVKNQISKALKAIRLILIAEQKNVYD